MRVTVMDFTLRSMVLQLQEKSTQIHFSSPCLRLFFLNPALTFAAGMSNNNTLSPQLISVVFYFCIKVLPQ